MKRGLLLVLLLGAASSAQAQLGQLISIGTRVGTNAILAGSRNDRPRDAKPDASVVPATYRGQTYPQKRTPANKLKGSGGDQIAYQESLLQQCQSRMLADSTAAIGTADLWATLQGSREVISGKRPDWNTEAYATEAAFYQAEDARRQRGALPAAR